VSHPWQCIPHLLPFPPSPFSLSLSLSFSLSSPPPPFILSSASRLPLFILLVPRTSEPWSMAVNVERTLQSTRESSLPLYFTLPFFLRRENSPARTILLFRFPSSLFATLCAFSLRWIPFSSWPYGLNVKPTSSKRESLLHGHLVLGITFVESTRCPRRKRTLVSANK